MESKREIELLAKGRPSLEKRDYKRAEIIFTELVEINPSHIEALFSLGNIYHAQGNLGKAIKAFKRVLDVDPEHTEAALSLSIIFNDIGKYDEGQKAFEKANEKVKRRSGQVQIDDPHLNNKFALKHLELAEMYFGYSRFDEALFEYNKAIGLNPSLFDARIKVAKVYAKKGYFSRAIEELKKLKAEQPTYNPARIALGIIFFGQGLVVEAQTEWQRVLAREPQNQEAQMYLKLAKGAKEARVQMDLSHEEHL